jgi:hypothetical protein
LRCKLPLSFEAQYRVSYHAYAQSLRTYSTSASRTTVKVETCLPQRAVQERQADVHPVVDVGVVVVEFLVLVPDAAAARRFDKMREP